MSKIITQVLGPSWGITFHKSESGGWSDKDETMPYAGYRKNEYEEGTFRHFHLGDFCFTITTGVNNNNETT